MEVYTLSDLSLDMLVALAASGTENDVWQWLYGEAETGIELISLPEAPTAADCLPWLHGRIFGETGELAWWVLENNLYQIRLSITENAPPVIEGISWGPAVNWQARGEPVATLLHGSYDVAGSQEIGRGSWSEARIPRWLHYPVTVDVTQPDQEDLRVVLVTQDYYAGDQPVPLTRLLRLETRMLEVAAV